MEVGAGEHSGTVLIHLQMALVLMAEASVTEVMSAGDPVRQGCGERCHTDRFLPKVVGDQTEVFTEYWRECWGS